MTKYSCDIHTAEGWESIALFSDKASLAAMAAFALEQYDCGNSLISPCDAVNIIDMETGEILWDTYSFFHNIEDFESADIDLQTLLEDGAHIINDTVVYPPDWYSEPADIDDDCGFDPYLGCYTDDC